MKWHWIVIFVKIRIISKNVSLNSWIVDNMIFSSHQWVTEYLYRIYPTRAGMLLHGATPVEDAVFEAHFAYLQAAVARDWCCWPAGR